MIVQIYHSLLKNVIKCGIVMTDDIFPVKKSAVHFLHNILCCKIRSRKQVFPQIRSKIMPSQQVIISANRLMFIFLQHTRGKMKQDIKDAFIRTKCQRLDIIFIHCPFRFKQVKYSLHLILGSDRTDIVQISPYEPLAIYMGIVMTFFLQ